MKNAIAVSLAVVVTLWAFWTELFPNTVFPLSSLSSSLNVQALDVSAPENSSVRNIAWDTWEKYLEAAKNHDLATVKSLSHQMSATCQDPAQEAECFYLMNSVYSFGSTFKRNDFTRIFADERQIVMMTDYEMSPEVGTQSIQVVLFFTKTPDGTPKVLGMRFCFKGPDNANSNCIETDPAKRDLDKNGWWDAVEALFYK
ncbi:MAG: hypothetical protein Q7R67_02655 [bacterium]|nr:hypothetical protein [bacterium]